MDIEKNYVNLTDSVFARRHKTKFLLFLGHRRLIKTKKQTAVINISVELAHFLIETVLDVSNFLFLLHRQS